MRCTKCGSDNREGRKFCAKCAAPLARLCPQCGASSNEPGEDFCGECAAALGQPPAASKKSNDAPIRVADTPAPENLDGERKTVTALFADIKGSTELMEDLDPEEARAIIDPALKLMIDAVHRYDGYVVQSTGDGIFALFGAPAAYEDHPQRGVYAALQIQLELRTHGERREAGGHAALEARVGVNTGEVVVRTVETGGRVEYTPIGHTLNLASRLQTIAPAGSIAVSEHTRRLVEGYFELRALGPTAVRGISEAIEVYEVTGLGTLRTHFELSTRRGLTKFVGRENELQQMSRALELAMAGQGQVVAVVAEAGTGKSRLYYEFKATLPAQCKVLEAYSVSHGKASAWLPVLELLRKYFGIADGDDAATRREKVSAALIALEPALSDATPYLFGLLGIVEGVDPLAQMDPQIKKQRTLDAIKRIVVRESLRQPLVVIFEDLHWIESETQELLDLLTDSIASARVLMLVNYRPEYRHQWGNKSFYSQLRLDALGGESVCEMLSALLGDGVELAPLKRLVIERTEGNPFFIEEMVQSLFDEGTLVRNGTVKVVRSLSQLRLPATVQGILAARIDRLPNEHKQLLQTLAVIGRESSLGLIRLVASKTMQLERMLANLQAGEFIYEQPALVDAGYSFKHALVREVAYNSILIARRKTLHERVAAAMESLYADRLDDHLSEVAHHLWQSGGAADAGKTVGYLEKAAKIALMQSAYGDSIRYLKNALYLLKKLPDSQERTQVELRLQLAMTAPLTAMKGYIAPEVERACRRARELCQQLGDPPGLFEVLGGLCSVYLGRGELRAAHELAEQMLRLAEIHQVPAFFVWANYLLGHILAMEGELILARAHLEQTVALYNPEQHSRYGSVQDPGVTSRGPLAHVLYSLGYPDQALRRSMEGLSLARTLSHPYSVAVALGYSAAIHRRRGEIRAALQLEDEKIALCSDRGFSRLASSAVMWRGFDLVECGSVEEGIAQILQGLGMMADTEAERQWGFAVLLPEALAKTGRVKEALAMSAEALRVIESVGRHDIQLGYIHSGENY